MNQLPKDPFVAPELTVDELSKALYKVTQSLQQSNELLIQSKARQQLFFSNISHDLRSPIAALRSSVEYLQMYQDLDSSEQAQIYDIMMKKITYMEQMINDLFLLSTLETKQRELQLKEVPIGSYLEEYYISCRQDPYYKNSILKLELPTEFPFLVQLDPHLFLRVLTNLFTNAMKYSEGTPYIKLSASLFKDDMVVVTVEDHGIGIAPEHLPHIFEESYMVSAARSPSATNSNGLGLAIVKSIVESHGGSIWCKSIEGQGSTFYFTLPLLN